MELLLPLLGFVVVATGTPGPNNLLLAASGMRFGIRATVPHLLGIHVGVYTMVVLSALGLSALIVNEPRVVLGLKVFASVYLLYLAWKILGFHLAGDENDAGKPLSLLQASVFQFSNPKAWFLATSGIGVVLPLADSLFGSVLLLCLTLATLGTLCNCTWVLLGANVRRYLAIPWFRRCFNGLLALVTVATVATFWIQ